jgi:hypothetical protein
MAVLLRGMGFQPVALCFGSWRDCTSHAAKSNGLETLETRPTGHGHPEDGESVAPNVTLPMTTIATIT